MFVDAIDVVFDAPWLTRDKAMIDLVKSIEIEKGKPFEPDPKLQATLDEAAADAHAWLDAKFETLFSSAFYEGTHWALPASLDTIGEQQTFYADPDSYLVDDRGVAYSIAFFCPKHTGAGSFYLMAIKGKGGLPLEGAGIYRLTVPTDVPVSQCWSATIYDRATHALIRNAKRSSISSQSPGLRHNDDGSVEVYFAPQALNGNEANTVPTNRDGDFEVLFRFYGPREGVVQEGLAASRHREAELAPQGSRTPTNPALGSRPRSERHLSSPDMACSPAAPSPDWQSRSNSPFCRQRQQRRRDQCRQVLPSAGHGLGLRPAFAVARGSSHQQGHSPVPKCAASGNPSIAAWGPGPASAGVGAVGDRAVADRGDANGPVVVGQLVDDAICADAQRAQAVQPTA